MGTFIINTKKRIIMKLAKKDVLEQMVCYDTKKVESGLLVPSPYQGDYLLKDGSISRYTVFNQETGILIDKDIWLSLQLSTQTLTASEAKAYYNSIDHPIPSLYQLIRLKLAVGEINKSLNRIGMKVFSLPEDILNQVWCEESLNEKTQTEKRRCVLIEPRASYQAPEYELIGGKYLLYKHKNLYKRTSEFYEPVKLVLLLNWNGIDFLQSEDEDINFYRNKDLQIHYLSIKENIRFYADELVRTENKLYQIKDGTIYLVTVLPNNVTICHNAGSSELIIEETQILSLDYRDTVNVSYIYQRGEDGLFHYKDKRSISA